MLRLTVRLALGSLLTLTAARAVEARDNKDRVREEREQKHERVIWGREIDHLDYLKFAAALATGVSGVSAYLQTLIADIARETGKSVAMDTLYDLLTGKKENTVLGDKPVYVGIETYSHWTEEKYPKIDRLTLGWGTIRVPRPNTHQFYVGIGRRGNPLSNEDSDVEVVDSKCVAVVIAASGDYVYWRDKDTTLLIRGVVADGRLHQDAIIDRNCRARLLTVDECGNIYWVDENSVALVQGQVVNNRLRRIATIDGSCNADTLGAQGGFVYWRDRGSKLLVRGKVEKGKLRQDAIIDKKSEASLLTSLGDAILWKDRDSNLLVIGTVGSDNQLRQEAIIKNAPQISAIASGGTPQTPCFYWKIDNFLYRSR